MKEYNLDYASTMPLCRTARIALHDIYADGGDGNPSSPHRYGAKARKYLERARETIAECINADPEQIIFNSGATEGNNHIARLYGFDYYCSDIEHHSVLKNSAGFCGYTDPDGIFRISTDKEYKNTSIMLVNNETGVIQPTASTATHTDATAAMGHMRVDVKELDVDYLTFSGHKFGAPKGIGCLYAKNPDTVKPMFNGGEQENGHRAGTVNVAGAYAMAMTLKELKNNGLYIRSIHDRLADILLTDSKAILNGLLDYSISSTLNVSFMDIDAESLVLMLNTKGIYCSAGSACTTGSIEPSHVIMAMSGGDRARATSAVRFSFGNNISLADVEHIGKEVLKTVEELRSLT